jgi:Predicted membrane protein
MARANKSDIRLDAPKGLRTSMLPLRRGNDRDRFGRFTEWIARAMGTPWFLFVLTVFCVLWLIWNTWGPGPLRFDSQKYGFTVLTLILSLQASYAAPLILLAQNRQDDRDRVQIEQDRQRAERNLADTEYLAREVVALRLAVKDMASKDFIRAELRALLEELERDRADHEDDSERVGG